MLEKVRRIWITDFLEGSLSREARILLGLSQRPDAVARPLDLLVQRPDQGERPLPPGMPIVKVFDDMGHLLILGAPGSGKTTLLLELARDLLDRAAQDPEHPIPVVFPLSTWAVSRKPLARWLVDELNLRYFVPRKIGQEWVDADMVLPLLDGLDEVEAAHRAACVEAINAFRTDRDLPLAICSRTADYQALPEPLQLDGAIVVQPLSPEQVDSYLAEIGPAGEAVRQAMSDASMLQEMLDSPLMLNIITAAYAGRPGSQPQFSGTMDERRDHLLGVYVDQMFRRRGVDRRYSPERTVYYLMWLARQMVRHSQTVFYIERLQPDWLPERKRRAFGPVVNVVAGLVFWLPFCLALWQVGALDAGTLLGGLVIGLVGNLVFGMGLVGRPKWLDWLFGEQAADSMTSSEIKCCEIVNWSWPKMSKRAVVFWSVCGLFDGLLLGAAIESMFVGLALGLVFVLCIFFLRGLSFSEIETRHIPNQGIHRSAWNALLFGSVFGLVFGLIGWPFGWQKVGVLGGLGAGQGAGGNACFRHLALRLWLVQSGSIPWNYVKFLDHAAERVLLRKVGGGYIFIHRMLLEYFAARYDRPAAEVTPSGKRSRRAIEM
jgi:DNA polymerase III delta prime subunit